MATFETVAQVVSLAARELGLVNSDIANPYASTDDNILRMCSLLTSAGREIVREHNWTQSFIIYTFATQAATETYDLPADFLRMVNQTGWDRTSRFPLGGPLSPQEWEYLNARLTAVTFRMLFRPLQRKLHLYSGNTIPAGHTIAFEYMSSYWVQANGQTAGNKQAPTAYNDTLLFDTHLMSRALKRAFLRATGFDTQAVEEDYQKALAAVMRDDTPAPVLSLTGRGRGELPVGEQSIPITGFGS